jgi:hypothetical protein
MSADPGPLTTCADPATPHGQSKPEFRPPVGESCRGPCAVRRVDQSREQYLYHPTQLIVILPGARVQFARLDRLAQTASRSPRGPPTGAASGPVTKPENRERRGWLGGNVV